MPRFSLLFAGFFGQGCPFPGITVMVVLAAVAFIAHPAAAQSRHYTSPSHDLQLSYPEAMVEYTPESLPGGVLLALKDAKNTYPTFNLLLVPEKYGLAGDNLHRQTGAILESYKQVGILDATSSSEDNVTVSGRSAFRTLMRYKNRGQDFVSAVTIVPNAASHLILTFTDRATDFPAHAAYEQEIRASLALNLQLLPPPQSSHISIWLQCGLLALGGAVLLAIVWRRYRQAGKAPH
jgi:hypothetical protein